MIKSLIVSYCRSADLCTWCLIRLSKTRMESASNKSALCQVSLPDFFNSVTGSTWASRGAQVQIAAGYHIFGSGTG